MRNYIVTGATGHIGNNLIRYILENEPSAGVTALLRSHTDLFSGMAVNEHIVDFDDDSALSALISRGSYLIHLAALIDLTDKKTSEMESVNFGLTKRLAGICLENKAKLIYCGSVDGIYKSGDGAIAEPCDYYPEKIEGGYGKTKAEAAKYLLQLMRDEKDFDCAIILPSAVMGINDYKPSEIGSVILNCVKGRPEFGLNGGYNFVDVRDVCAAIHNAVLMERCGQYIVSGENVSVRELYRLINKAVGVERRPVIIPDFLISLLMPFVGVLNPITVKSLKEPHLYSCQKAVKELGLTLTPIEETVRNTVEWFKRNLARF